MIASGGIPTGTAILLALFAASLWGSWSIALKFLGDFPLDGFIIILFATSIIFVWSVALFVEHGSLWRTLADALAHDPSVIGATLLGGIVYVVGIRFTLVAQRTIGLSLAQPIQSSLSVLIGTSLSAAVGGVPGGISFARLLLGSSVLVGAVCVTLLAGHFRSQVHTVAGHVHITMRDMWQALGAVVLSSIFTPAYPLALSFGLRSATHSRGLPVLPFMTLLATGAFAGALLTSGVSLTRNRLWSCVLHAPPQMYRWGVMAGLFHYGGNIIHTTATAYLSSAVTWPLGVSSGFWTQLWGLVYGEFRGASRRAYCALAIALGLYLAGVYLIATTLYR